MIYWHVEKGAVCIYPQLKRYSSSEVVAIMDGVLRHYTEMTVEKNYVESHCQSAIGLAFTHLLGFQLLARLKGIYRRAWVRNNLLLERTSATAEALGTAGIRALFVEGATLAACYYPELGMRPTMFVTLLVDEDAEAAALALLPRCGWHEPPGAGPVTGAPRSLYDRDANVCLLRTSIAYDFVLPSDPAGSHAPLWEAAATQAVSGSEVLVPSATDALLAVCVAGARRGPVPNIQWIVDAAMVLRTQSIDWGRLLDVGISRGQALRLRDAFRYLAQIPCPRPPDEVRRRLEATSASPRERLAHACAAGSVRGLGALPEIVAEHLAATAGESATRALLLFPGRLRERWNVDSSRKLPLAASQRAWRLLSGGSRKAA